MKHVSLLILAAVALAWTVTGCGPKAAPEAAPSVTAETESISLSLPPMGTDFALPPISAEDAAEVIAIVNGTEITEGEIHTMLGRFLKQMGPRIPQEQLGMVLPQLRERIIEDLIMRQVMLDEVAKRGLSFSDVEYAEIKAELSGELPPGMSFDAYLAEAGISETEMREQMLIRKMIIAQASIVTAPTDDEIKAFYDENQADFVQDETVTASHILITVDAENDDDAAKAAKLARIEDIRKQAMEGGDFAALATAHSDCPSSSSGGSLGSFGRGQMVPAFEAAAFAQPVGSVGEVVETPFGYHLIKVSEHVNAKTLDFAEVKTRVSDILFSKNQQNTVRDFVAGLQSQATIQRLDEPEMSQEDLMSMMQIEFEDEEEVVAEEVVEEVPAEVVVTEVVAEPVVEEVVVVEEVIVEEVPAVEEVIVVEEVTVEEVPAEEAAE